MYNEIQKLNDDYLELDSIITELDNLLGNLKCIEIVYEDWDGHRRVGEIDTLNEDDIEELKKLYYRLEKLGDK